MKIWISDIKSDTHRNIRLNCEEHSNFQFLGDLSDNELKCFLLEAKPDLDVEKNIHLLHYFGYLHLFIIHKKV